jgi:hypothetical protein
MRLPLPAALLACLFCLAVGYALGREQPSARKEHWVAPGVSGAALQPRSAPRDVAPSEGTVSVVEELAAPKTLAPSRPVGGLRADAYLMSLDLRREHAREVLSAVARLYLSEGRRGEAGALALQALDLAPFDPHLLALLREADPLAAWDRALRGLQKGGPNAKLYPGLLTGLLTGLPPEARPAARERLVAELLALEGRAGDAVVYRNLLRVDPRLAVQRFALRADAVQDAYLLMEFSRAADSQGSAVGFEWGVRAHTIDPDLTPPPARTAQQLGELERLVAHSAGLGDMRGVLVRRHVELRASLVQSYVRQGRASEVLVRVARWRERLSADDLSTLAYAALAGSKDRGEEGSALMVDLLEQAAREEPTDSERLTELSQVDAEAALRLYAELLRVPSMPWALGEIAGDLLSDLVEQTPQAVVPWLSRHSRVLKKNEYANLVEQAFYDVEDVDLARQIYTLARGRFPALPAWSQRLAKLKE